jgi:chemotaxis protein CheX
MAAQPSQISDLRSQEMLLVAGSIGFIGDANGLVYIYFEEPFAKMLASRMLHLSEVEVESVELVNDVIGEISNMVVGATKSRICDSGASCRLTIPSVIRGRNLKAEPAGGSESRLVSMDCGGETVLLELIMKSHTQP